MYCCGSHIKSCTLQKETAKLTLT